MEKLKYKIGDTISVPKQGDLKINGEVLYLFNGFLEYDTKYCIILIKGYSEGYPYLLNLDIKIFLHLCYTENYKKYKKFFSDLYKDFPCKESACILQLISHRIFEKEGYTKELEKNLKSSIDFFENSEWHKWRISGKFFISVYSGNEEITFKNFIDCLDTNKLSIDMDCYQDKIGYIVSWLRFKYSKQSDQYLKKLYNRLEEFGYHYSEALDPLIKFHKPNDLGKHIIGYNSESLWEYVNENRKNMKYKRICILGSTGLVGSSVYKKYIDKYPAAIILAPKRYNLDLENREQVIGYFLKNKPDLVFMCAAKVGGIKANNDYKADFITANLKIQNNVIEACHLANSSKLVFLGSSCIYPKNSEIPIKEEYLMTGHLEETNDAYAIAKIAGIKMCQAYNQQYERDYISVMPCNLYGPGDNFDLNNSHVLPALIRKFHEAKEKNLPEVEIWGTGKPMREFLYAEDLADALIYLSENYSSPEIINVGTGNDISILDLAKIISKEIDYKGKIRFNSEYPDGTYRKVMDVSKIFETGWRPLTTIEEGIKKTYEYYKKVKC
jgi:GDP-L-fucose synthase